MLLLEGGLGGHMNHLYDNRELSFAKMKEIIHAAASGKLQVAEKTDGQNLFISYSIPEGKAKSARNKGNIKSGGMDAAELASKFSGRGGLYDAFTDSFAAFEAVIKKMPVELQRKIFGDNADIFYNAEVMDPRSANVINYDRKYLLIHREGHAKFDRNTGEIEDIDVSDNAAVLEKALKQYAGTNDTYNVMMKTLRPIEAISNKQVLNNTIERLNQFMNKHQLSDDDTVGDYIVNSLAFEIEKLNNKFVNKLSEQEINTLVRKMLGDKGIKVVEVYKNLQPQDKEAIKSLVDNADDLLKKLIFPLEDIIHDFAVEVLRGMKSLYVLDNSKEVQRLKNEVSNVLNQIKASGNQQEYDFIEKQLRKLKSLENINTPVEGIVFQYDGNLFKLTGNFAPINQLLGFFKYGRSEKLKENQEINSNSQKAVYFVFGRMNPPTLGHGIMLQEGLQMAKKNNSDFKIYLSKTSDNKKNPLPYVTKVELFKKMFPQFAQYLVEDPNIKTAVEVLGSLSGKYSKAVMLVGEDRVSEFQNLLTQYNNIEYAFDEIVVQNTGGRVSGRSATAMRAFVSKGDLQGFINAYKESFPNLDTQTIEEMYNAIDAGFKSESPKRKKKKIGLEEILQIISEMSAMSAGSAEIGVGKDTLFRRKKNKKGTTVMKEINEDEAQLRQVIKNAIRLHKMNKLQEFKKSKLEEQQLRFILRKLIMEVGDDQPIHDNTGINVLEDLLKKIIPVIQTDYKIMTTSETQRLSFRAHILNAIQNSLKPELYRKEEPPPGAPLQEKKVKIDLEDSDMELDKSKFIDVFDTEKKKAEEDEKLKTPESRLSTGLENKKLDSTGRNMALQTFKKIDNSVMDAYTILDDAKDKDLFYDYLITNLKLYFDKFEEEMMDMPKTEPTTPEYQAEKEKKEQEDAPVEA